MAVVQISKIQHRRGKETISGGIPQLASAELGWAIDTQKLYIGNGSVSEGAPAVGNTEILTANTNLFDLFLVINFSYKVSIISKIDKELGTCPSPPLLAKVKILWINLSVSNLFFANFYSNLLIFLFLH